MRGENVDEKVYKYRKRHPCCNYYKYLKLEVPPVYCVSSYYNCKAKDKIIHCIYPLPARRLPSLRWGMNCVPRFFCKLLDNGQTM